MSPEARAVVERRWFELYEKEQLGKTPKITKELDHIEEVLRLDSEQKSNAHLDPSFEGPNGSTAPTVTNSQKLLTNGGGATPGVCNYRG